MRKLLYFASQSCPPCLRIWRDVVVPKIVPQATDGQVVKIMADEQPALARQYNIKYTPTVVLVNGDGTEYGRRIGDPTPRLKDILTWLAGDSR